MSISQNPRSAANSRSRHAALVSLSSLLLLAVSVMPCAIHFSSSQAQAKSVIVAKPASISECTGCHGANLEGRTGFSPSITSSGILKEYKKKSFEAVMKTGVTPGGGMVKKPMPIFKQTAAVSDAQFAYLKSIK